jgi:hypothetical protein
MATSKIRVGQGPQRPESHHVDFEFARDEGKRGVEVVMALPGAKVETISFSNAKDLFASERFGEILGAAKDGHVLSIDYWITAFINKKNDKLVRVKPGTIASLKDTFSRPLPILRSHEWGGQKHGKVVAVEMGEGTQESIDAKLSLRRPSSQEDYLRGMVESYSAGMTTSKPRMCSVCDAKWSKDSRYGYERPGCDHEPGVRYGGKVCETFIEGATLTEISIAERPFIEDARNKSQVYGSDLDAQNQSGEESMEFEKLKGDYDALQVQFEDVCKSADKAKVEYEAKIKDMESTAVDFAINCLVSRGCITPARAKDEKFLATFSKLGPKEGFELFAGERVAAEFSNQRLSRQDLNAAPPTDAPPASPKPYVFGQSAKAHGLTD